MYSKEQLIPLIQRDPSLTYDEKEEVIERLNDAKFYEDIIHGSIGAGVAVVISKFLKLSKTAQVLLGLAGFGIGKYLLDASRKHDRFLQYNEKLKVYEIKK